MTHPPIWPNGYKIPFILITGAFGSGKTSFALDVDPVLKGQGKTRTLYVDMENSGADYENQYELDRIDMPRHMAQKVGSWNNGQLWTECKKLVMERVKTGRYTNAIFDTVANLQDGAFQVARGDTMLRWAATKKDLEDFFNEVAAYVQTVIMITHLRNKRDGSEKEAKGVETFRQLASFFVYLHRDPNAKVRINGQQYDACPKYPYPSGIILKSRLNVTTNERDEYGGFIRRPLLPNRIPVCTPAALRSRYINNKAVVFTDEEQLPDLIPGLQDQLSDDDKLLIANQQAQAEREKAQAEVEITRQKRVEMGKQRLFEDYVTTGVLADGRALREALTAVAPLLGIADYDPDRDLDIRTEIEKLIRQQERS